MPGFQAKDITVGLALFLDPEVLQRERATWTGEETDRILGPHYFLCLEVGPREGRWLPLFSSVRFDRMPLEAAKTGHPAWTGKTSYYDPNQLWTARHDAVLRAAAAAGDATGPWEPNTADPGSLPDLWWLRPPP